MCVTDIKNLSYLRRMAGILREAALRYAVPSIDVEDAYVLMAAAALSPTHPPRAADLGAGIGYSTLWIAAGRGAGTVYAVEVDQFRCGVLQRNLGHSGIMGVEVVAVKVDAIQWLKSLPESYLSFAFLDIEKNKYPQAIQELSRVLAPGGVLAAHNALLPPPPPETFEFIRKRPWETHLIIPTHAGILIARKAHD